MCAQILYAPKCVWPPICCVRENTTYDGPADSMRYNVIKVILCTYPIVVPEPQIKGVYAKASPLFVESVI